MEKEKNLKSNVKWKFIHYEYEKKQKYKSNLWKCWSAEKTDCNETQCFPGRFAACNIDQFEFIEFKCMKFIWFKYTEWKPLASIEMKIEYARVLWNIVERKQKCEFHQCFPEKLKKKLLLIKCIQLDVYVSFICLLLTHQKLKHRHQMESIVLTMP